MTVGCVDETLGGFRSSGESLKAGTGSFEGARDTVRESQTKEGMRAIWRIRGDVKRRELNAYEDKRTRSRSGEEEIAEEFAADRSTFGSLAQSRLVQGLRIGIELVLGGWGVG